jgi:hypothetical protein
VANGCRYLGCADECGRDNDIFKGVSGANGLHDLFSTPGRNITLWIPSIALFSSWVISLWLLYSERSKVIPESEWSTTNNATVTILESTLYSLTDVEIPVTTQCNRPLYRKKK